MDTLQEFINQHYTNKNTLGNITRAFRIFKDKYTGDIENVSEVIEYSKTMNTIHNTKALLSLMSVYHNKQIPEYTEELKKTNQNVNKKTIENKIEVHP